MIGIAIVGCGRIAHQHAAALGNLGTVPTALVDTDIERARVLAGKFQDVPMCTDNIESVLANDSIGAAIICLPHSLHSSMAITCMCAGWHVLVEKPMCLQYEEAANMMIAATANHVNLMVGHALRFSPVYIMAKELIRDGRIGIPVNVVVRRHTRRGSAPTKWSYDPEIAGNWLLYGLGVHEIDIITWLLDTYTTHVYAQGSIADSAAWKTCDEISIQGRLANNVITNINLSNNTSNPKLDISIVGTTGDIVIDSGKDIYVNGTIMESQSGGMFGRQMVEFTSSITDGRQPESSAQSVFNTMRTIWAVESSMGGGGIVCIT